MAPLFTCELRDVYYDVIKFLNAGRAVQRHKYTNWNPLRETTTTESRISTYRKVDWKLFIFRFHIIVCLLTCLLPGIGFHHFRCLRAGIDIVRYISICKKTNSRELIEKRRPENSWILAPHWSCVCSKYNAQGPIIRARVRQISSKAKRTT